MPVVPTTAYSQAEDALSLARALLNDTAGAVFTDTLLMPLLNSAYRALQRELAENGVSVLVEQQDLSLATDPVSGITPHLLSAVGRAQNVVAHLGRALSLRSTLRPDHYEAESSYFHIKVYPSDGGESRTLLLDHLIHGYAFRDYPRMLKYDYEGVYASIMERAHPSNGSLQAFFMGGGSYTFPRFVEAVYPGSRIVVAEIDPAVTEAVHAEMFLPRDTKIETIYGDARNTVDRLVAQGAHFDFIYGDAFNDVTIPFHLTTHEFNERLLRLLAPDGIYLSNLIDTYRNARFLGAFIHTARQTFAHVAVFATGPEFRDLGRDTYTIVMSPRPIDLRRLGSLPGERPFSGLALSDADIQVAIERSGPTLLTDDYAPVDNLLAAVARER